jgi:hypothetical protein
MKIDTKGLRAFSKKGKYRNRLQFDYKKCLMDYYYYYYYFICEENIC